MGERLARHGYFVLLPDLFWRAGPYAPINVKEVFADEAKRREAFGKLMGSTNPEKQLADAKACLDWLAEQPEVQAGQGRRHRLLHGRGRGDARRRRPTRTASPPPPASTAGAWPPTRPTAPTCWRAEDQGQGADRRRRRGRRLPARAGRQAARCADRRRASTNEVTIYAGARHGYTMPDLPVYDEGAAERHWTEMLALFDETLKETVAA